jgi:hypothetical protein
MITPDGQEQILSWMLIVIFGWCVYIYATAPIRRGFYEELKNTLADNKVTEEEQGSLISGLQKALKLMTRTKAAFLVLLVLVFRGPVLVKMAKAYNLDGFADWMQSFWPQYILYILLYLVLFVEALRVDLVIRKKKD